MWGYGLDRADSGWRQVAGICECSNEPSGSITSGEMRVTLKLNDKYIIVRRTQNVTRLSKGKAVPLQALTGPEDS